MGHHVFGKNVFRIVGAVEQEVKGVLGMLPYHANQRFVGETPDAFKLVAGQQKADVDGDLQRVTE